MSPPMPPHPSYPCGQGPSPWPALFILEGGSQYCVSTRPPHAGTLIAINSNQQRPSSPHRTMYFLDVGGRVYRLEDPRGVLLGIPPATRVVVKTSAGPGGTNTLVVKKARAVAPLTSGSGAPIRGGSGPTASSAGAASLPSQSPTAGAAPPYSGASAASVGGEDAATTAFQPVGVLEDDLIAVGPGNVVWTGGSSLVRDIVLAVQGLSEDDGEPEMADGAAAPGGGGSSPAPDSGTNTAGASQAPQGAAVYSGTPPRVVTDMRTIFYIMDFCGMGGGPVATVSVGGLGGGFGKALLSQGLLDLIPG